jgi:DNA adenine methylase
MSVFRYPGGKGKVAKVITNRLSNFMVSHPDFQYREPFFGAGAIGFDLLRDDSLDFVWFNDRDPAICAVWNSAIYHREELFDLIESFLPTVDSYFEFKEFLLGVKEPIPLEDPSLVSVAFKKIACHQMSYSGLGTKAGGPIGGVAQTSDYPVGCRYSIRSLKKSLNKVFDLLGDRIPHAHDFCTCLDFAQVIEAEHPEAFLYCDPPYFDKGPELYQFSFTMGDHERLAAVLRKTEHPWLLSYDDHPQIREMYAGWSEFEHLDLTYTINGPTRKKEVLISSKNFNEAKYD